MIHMFRKKPKFSVSYTIFQTIDKKAIAIHKVTTDFSNLKDAAAFLQYSFQIDTGFVSYYADDNACHYIDTKFYYGIGYSVKFDDIETVADVERITPSGRYTIKTHPDLKDLLMYEDRR